MTNTISRGTLSKIKTKNPAKTILNIVRCNLNLSQGHSGKKHPQIKL